MTTLASSQLQEFTRERLIGLILQLYETIATLESEIQSLKKNSSNSSKPPSADFPTKRNQSLRQSSGKPSGGQAGHPGTTRAQVEHPDTIIPCKPSTCERCGIDLTALPGVSVGKRQEADIPPVSVTVTEYRQEEVICPCCGRRNIGFFPEGINAQFQLGNNPEILRRVSEHRPSYSL